MNNQNIIDKLYALECSALEGRNAFSSSSADEKVCALLGQFAEDLREVIHMVGFTVMAGSLPEPVEAAVPDHGLRPMSSAPKDGTPVLLKFKAAGDLPEKASALAERWFVGGNNGDLMEWSFAAPVGYDGIPAAWLVGWMPTPASISPRAIA